MNWWKSFVKFVGNITMEKVVDTLLETSIAQSQQITCLCKSIEALCLAIDGLHKRIQVLEGQVDPIIHSRN